MAHQTHLYAAISSGTVTAQTFEQLPTAIIKKKKKKNNQEKCLFLGYEGGVFFFFFPSAQL